MPPSLSSSADAARRLLSPGRDSDYGARGRSPWLDVDWSQHLHRMEIRGSEVEYVDMGPRDADAIVWIHGLGACWQTWLENLPQFAETHRCVALDLPGFGRSPLPDYEITMEAYAGVVDELCDRLGIERAAVVGNSMGGFVGATMAIHFDTRVDRLVLVSAAIFWQEYRRAKPLVTLARTTDATLGRAIVHGQPMMLKRPRLRALGLAFGGIRYPHLLPRELQAELLLTARRTRGFLPALEALADYPLREELAKVACPTLIVWGTDDTLVSVRHAHELETLLPNARKEIFEATGHVAMLERPERFNRLVGEFLSAGAGAAEPAEATAA
ncbi:MAG TPA: alpha/beta hydrolase [Solirubrobacteraceae bacterium]|nr:alpha/beta hydrolase [Solirubrobacteraceae bacterium]